MPPGPDPTSYEGLLALLQNEFPKVCPSCGREYPTLENFVDETQPVNQGTGLMGYDLGDGDHQQVAMLRNCACGSTMATFCSDRRDGSEGGMRRRAAFENLLDDLESQGIDALVARDELLAFLRGERSPILEGMGVFRRPRGA
ncbi:MAG: hypothetical protein PHC88_08065 [Terrimicrobiaceae bacterium]|nr:hypothetical protein [Terrimicrobiaceae bacterium]